ncbi:hypothetical protein, partial [Streptomyces sp. NPDC059616]|uniref:hypothetical protein n=1 Tax=Streptomyces sp. NPDC059616 TaxID=3346886 RepID=UPI0036C78313
MNTFTNVLGTAALITLVLLPALAGLARERRIDRELRAAERARSDGPPQTTGAGGPPRPGVGGPRGGGGGAHHIQGP